MLEQQLVNALSLGCVYALFALGFTLVFGVLGVINLSHGAVFMVGAYAALQVVTRLAFPLWASLIAAFVISGALGLAIDMLVLRPLRRRNAPHLIPMIATIGIAIFFNSASQACSAPRTCASRASWCPTSNCIWAACRSACSRSRSSCCRSR